MHRLRRSRYCSSSVYFARSKEFLGKFFFQFRLAAEPQSVRNQRGEPLETLTALPTAKTNSPRSNQGLARPEETRCGEVLSSLETRLHSTSKFHGAVSRRIPLTTVILMNFLLFFSLFLLSFVLFFFFFSKMTLRFVPSVIKLIFRE